MVCIGRCAALLAAAYLASGGVACSDCELLESSASLAAEATGATAKAARLHRLDTEAKEVKEEAEREDEERAAGRIAAGRQNKQRTERANGAAASE